MRHGKPDWWPGLLRTERCSLTASLAHRPVPLSGRNWQWAVPQSGVRVPTAAWQGPSAGTQVGRRDKRCAASRDSQPPYMTELIRMAQAGEETSQSLLTHIGQQALTVPALPEATFKANFDRMFSDADA